MFLVSLTVQAVDHTFNYQGELIDSGIPADGTYDIAIQAFDAASLGNTVGIASIHNGVTVSDGLFTLNNVDIDMGTFDGLDLWLQISVKQPLDVTYTQLTPLQKLYSVPYATSLIDKGATNGQVLTFNNVDGWLPADANSGTDNQNIENLSLSGTVLSIGIEDGNTQSVNLLSLQDGSGTDNQNLSLVGNTLSISNGTGVTFSGWDINNTDDFSGNYNDLTNQPTIPAASPWNTNGTEINYLNNVGIGNTNPSAKLEVTGQIKITGGSPGADKVLTSDATGLASWETISAPAAATYSIGDYAHGGVVFWVSPNGEHGKVVHIYDSISNIWSNLTSVNIGNSARDDKSGAMNTIKIILQSGHTFSAAIMCKELSYGGFDDWYLPAIDELVQIMDNRAIINTTTATYGGDFISSNYHWSSTEEDSSHAWALSYFHNSGNPTSTTKGTAWNVKAVRAF